MTAHVINNIGQWPKRRGRTLRPRADGPATDMKADFELSARSWSEIKEAYLAGTPATELARRFEIGL